MERGEGFISFVYLDIRNLVKFSYRCMISKILYSVTYSFLVRLGDVSLRHTNLKKDILSVCF